MMSHEKPALFHDNDLLEIQNMESLRSDLKKNGVSGEEILEIVMSTQTFLNILSSGISVSGIKNEKDRDKIMDRLEEGLDIMEEIYPNITLQAENEYLYNIAIDAVIEF
jgi:hypothetical protein